ncbi:hypothetical protein VTK73DRAFT_4905 [Phialemonium thermophilum]|uniref:Uncharacterized protein n=1 Tax=Phialemonium thermophilum TaxID=223376 RepID=A0ABR3WRL2_9PEZI
MSRAVFFQNTAISRGPDHQQGYDLLDHMLNRQTLHDGRCKRRWRVILSISQGGYDMASCRGPVKDRG